MSTVFYRAKLVLEEVTTSLDERGYKSERASAIADFTVTGDSPYAAMTQASSHVGELEVWHRTHPADDLGWKFSEDIERCPSCSARYRRRPINKCTHMWHQPEAEVTHEQPAHMTTSAEASSPRKDQTP